MSTISSRRLSRIGIEICSQHNTVAIGTLAPGGQHPRIVLIGRQNLVSGSQIEAELAVLE
jgi:hypothetical protein